MTKARKLASDLNSVVSVVGNGNIKFAVGDSTRNHRVATINQVIRFLESRADAPFYTNGESVFLASLNRNTQLAYNTLSADILAARKLVGSNRTDAIDIYEFIGFLENSTKAGTKLKDVI